jgi:gamma-glutamylcyclotransferase (GGCT)/AIG2-like uncharacterized protein YtfP
VGVTEERLPLFVYGTLKTGEINQDCLIGVEGKRCHALFDGGELFLVEGNGYNYPAMIIGNSLVEGELVWIGADEDYDEALAKVDELELVDAEYERRIVRVYQPDGALIEAYAYFWPGCVDGLKRLSCRFCW